MYLLLLDLPEPRSSSSLSFHVATPQHFYIHKKKSHFTALHNIVQNHLCLTCLSRPMCFEIYAFQVHFPRRGIKSSVCGHGRNQHEQEQCRIEDIIVHLTCRTLPALCVADPLCVIVDVSVDARVTCHRTSLSPGHDTGQVSVALQRASGITLQRKNTCLIFLFNDALNCECDIASTTAEQCSTDNARN